MTETLDKKIDTVQKLLAKAASTNFPAEADALRAKAEEIMSNYAIEQWQLERAQRGPQSARPVAVKSAISIAWYWELEDQTVATSIFGTLWDVCQHCRLKTSVVHIDYKERTLPVVGMHWDIEYAKVLFTDIFQQMVDALDPRPRSGEEMLPALARMKEAGMKWEDIYDRLVKAGLVEDHGPWSKSVASKMNFAGKYTKFCEETLRPRTRVAPSVYRRSFVVGFRDSVYSQLLKSANAQTGSMALALKDYTADVEKAWYEFFPKREATQTDESTTKSGKPRKTRARKPRPPKMSYSAMNAGQEAGNNIRILGQDEAASRQRRPEELGQ